MGIATGKFIINIVKSNCAGVLITKLSPQKTIHRCTVKFMIFIRRKWSKKRFSAALLCRRRQCSSRNDYYLAPICAAARLEQPQPNDNGGGEKKMSNDYAGRLLHHRLQPPAERNERKSSYGGRDFILISENTFDFWLSDIMGMSNVFW